MLQILLVKTHMAPLTLSIRIVVTCYDSTKRPKLFDFHFLHSLYAARPNNMPFTVKIITNFHLECLHSPSLSFSAVM